MFQKWGNTGGKQFVDAPGRDSEMGQCRKSRYVNTKAQGQQGDFLSPCGKQGI
jgi:hypothetical protein